MFTCIQWEWPGEGVRCYDELGDDRWATRHIEIRTADGGIAAACALDEVLAARDSGVPGAVTAYEARFGVLPDGPFPAAAGEPLPADEFERLWRSSRRRIPPPAAGR